MCSRISGQTLISLSLFFVFATISIHGQTESPNKTRVIPCNISKGGQGFAIDNGINRDNILVSDSPYIPKNRFNQKPEVYSVAPKPIQFVSKPIAKYTVEARENCIVRKSFTKNNLFR